MPKSRHPLRTLRAATPHGTQAAFAAFLGVPVAAVQAVESGRARLSPRIAARIKEMTGADDVELLRGADGAAVTLEGKRYTLRDFEAWQDSPGQAAERARRKTQERLHHERWTVLAAVARHGGEPEEVLRPWQTCELASAAVRDWKRLPEHTQRLTGWSPALTAGAAVPSARLTLSVQTAPVWNPAAAPPGLSAANAELFPPCYFTVAAGSGGCRMAAAYWRMVCSEHGVDAESGARLHESPTGSWRGFFRARPGGCEAHAVFAGLNAHETAALAGGLFPPGGVLSGGGADAQAEEALRFMQEHSEDAGSPAGILLFASLEGGTASALGSGLLARLRAQFPALPIFVIGVLPLSGVSSVVAAPWHLALAHQALRRHASAALLFSNEQLLTQAARDWHLPSPGYAEANLLIAECLCALTAPLRFGGTDAPPLDLRALLGCFPAEAPPPVLSAECRPLAALVDRRLKSLTLPWLMARAVPACTVPHAVFLRTRLEPGDEWVHHDAPPVVSLTGRAGPGRQESVTVVAEMPVIRRTLRRLARQARELLKLDNAPALAAQIGAGMDQLQEAIAAMEAMPAHPASLRTDAAMYSRASAGQKSSSVS